MLTTVCTCMITSHVLPDIHHTVVASDSLPYASDRKSIIRTDVFSSFQTNSFHVSYSPRTRFYCWTVPPKSIRFGLGERFSQMHFSHAVSHVGNIAHFSQVIVQQLLIIVDELCRLSSRKNMFNNIHTVTTGTPWWLVADGRFECVSKYDLFEICNW